MIPTLYGLRVANHLLLGCPDPLVGSRRPSVPLQWKKVPPYSDNIRLNLLPTIGDFFSRLQKKCFIGTEGKVDEHFTPLTYAYLVRSLCARACFNEAECEALNQPSLLPPSELAWKTCRAWMDGHKLLKVCVDLSLMMSQTTDHLRLVLASYSQSRVHFIDNFQLSRKEGKAITASFLLAADHQLDMEETVIYLAHGPSIPVTSPVPLKSASFEPFKCSMPCVSRSAAISSAFSCREFEEFYQLELLGIEQDGKLGLMEFRNLLITF